MMRIRWTPAAAGDLQHISDYLKQHHPQYRQPALRKLYDTIRSLTQSPYRGRPSSEEGTREIQFTDSGHVLIEPTLESGPIVPTIHALQSAILHCSEIPKRDRESSEEEVATRCITSPYNHCVRSARVGSMWAACWAGTKLASRVVSSTATTTAP